MSLILQILVLLLGVGVSSLLVRPLRVPLPFVQIAVGAMLSLPLFGVHVSMNPEIFLLLFVAPLLFVDGARIPKREFFATSGLILALAFGLVLFTVALVGLLIHWMIPAIPGAAAFALAAILSPTDAVAVSALTERVGMPKRLLHLLQGEALMNDASGLAAFNMAVAVLLTGTFSWTAATLGLVTVAVGGATIGSACGLIWSLIGRRLTRWGVEEQATNVMMLLLPFVAYLAAERAHLSGILAAVAAGIVLNLREPPERSAASRLGAYGMWSMIEFIFNGLIFVVLGLQLPAIFSATIGGFYSAGSWPGVAHLALYAFAVALSLMLLRFAWVWITVRLVDIKARRHGRGGRLPRRRLLAAMALAGVRGAVTLAGVMSVPLLLRDGSPLPGRDLMIFLAAAVILLSLLIAAFGLPHVLKGLEVQEDPEIEEERLARVATAESAIRAIQAEAASATWDDRKGGATTPSMVADVVIGLYQRRLQQLGEAAQTTEAQGDSRLEHHLRLTGLHAERVAISQLRRSRRIDNGVQEKLLRDVDLREAAIVGTRR
ncbi:MAG TPA: Na+/H+ antiporter [Rhodanobacter sp.]